MGGLQTQGNWCDVMKMDLWSEAFLPKRESSALNCEDSIKPGSAEGCHNGDGRQTSKPSRLHLSSWSCWINWPGLQGLQTTKIYFSQFWRHGSLRWRGWQTWRLVRSQFLIHRPTCSWNLQRFGGAPWVSCKVNNAAHEGSTPKVWSPPIGPHPQTPTQC